MLGQGCLRALRKRRLNSALILSRGNSTWASHISHSASLVQTHISRTHDPYVNLSIEHFLLDNTPKNSYVLFLYVNRPSVVIGRNQNPWVEVNLHALDGKHLERPHVNGLSESARLSLVRRRSGGGTVFHDEGNVNWTVICPSSEFTRDKHAEMVVRALRGLGIERARVNERHDIVLDQGTVRHDANEKDYHSSPFSPISSDDAPSLKVSGSAYKLTRGRALHHGTCLLQSPNLGSIRQYLRSHAAHFIKAKGVESVSSPVTNVGVGVQSFQTAVAEQFWSLYRSHGMASYEASIAEDALEVPKLRQGWEELQTPEWTFGQTPRFTFSTSPTTEDDRQRPTSPGEVFLSIRNCEIQEAKIALSHHAQIVQDERGDGIANLLNGRKLWHDWQWSEALVEAELDGDKKLVKTLGAWLNEMLPTGQTLVGYIGTPKA